MKEIEWFGCYADSWQGEIVPEAFSHPAKFSRGLIARIYDHMLDSGYIKPGDIVGDPFGGVALGAIHAMLKGLHWRGVELEAKFVDLGGQNIALWQSRYGDLLRGTAVLAQGDSRQFLQHVAGIGGVVSSAPFTGVMPSQEAAEWHQARESIGKNNSLGKSTAYGSTPGQLGAMPEGDLSAVVKSKIEIEGFDGSSLVYILFFNPDNGIAFFLEVPILPSVLSDLAGLGMPVIPVNLDDYVPVRQKEIAVVVRNLELSNIVESSTTQEGGEGVFKVALSGHPITPERTIDAFSILDLIGLHGEQTPAGRALFFEAVASGSSGTGVGTILSYSAFKNALIDTEFYTAECTVNNFGSILGLICASSGTVATPIFGLRHTSDKALLANFTNKFHPVSVSDARALSGTIDTPSLFDLIGSSIEFFGTGETDGIRDTFNELPVNLSFSPLENSVARSAAKGVIATADSLFGSFENDPTLIAFKFDKIQDITSRKSPSIITPNKEMGIFSAIVSSPAYADVINGAGEGPGARYDHIHHNGDNATKKTSAAEYGRTAGNLGNLAAVVSSAPFESSLQSKDEKFNADARSGRTMQVADYGDHPANIGNDTGSTFWQAAAEIVAQAYAALKPGAYAAFVCGDYVRGGERVCFGRQWLELCESVGFVPVEWITAWKTEYKGTQLDIFGNEHEKRIDRVSFFRRLANERNPDAAILNEDVVIVRKPL